jgi:hypothetical protein
VIVRTAQGRNGPLSGGERDERREAGTARRGRRRGSARARDSRGGRAGWSGEILEARSGASSVAVATEAPVVAAILACRVYEVTFAKRERLPAETLRRARHLIRMRNFAQIPESDVLPARIKKDGTTFEVWHSFVASNALP